MGKANRENGKKLYRLVLFEDDTHKRLRTARFTRNGFIVLSVTAAVILLILIYLLFAFTPLRTTIPGYPDEHSKYTAVSNAIKIDSLESIITRWEVYAGNLSRVLEGERGLDLDSILHSGSSKYLSGKTAEELSGADSLLRLSIQQAEQFSISNDENRNLPLRGRLFFAPMKGVVARQFAPSLHPGVDISAPSGSAVSAVLDGTVIYTGWGDEEGFTVHIQHSGDLTSIYKHNSQVLKKVGEKVSAGTPVAILGNAGTLSSGDYLHFELWYKGEALDPEQYIKF